MILSPAKSLLEDIEVAKEEGYTEGFMYQKEYFEDNSFNVF